MILAAIALTTLAPVAVRAQFGLSGSFLNAFWQDKERATLYSFSGFEGMATVNIPFSRIVGINLGAGYEYLNRKEDPKVVGGNAAECYTREQQVRVPLQLTINIPISGGFGFLLYGGATGSFAITGINSMTIKYDDGSTGTLTYDYYKGIESRSGMSDSQYSVAVSSLDKTPSMLRYDVAAEAGLGIRINSLLMVRAGYNYGLLNRYKDSSNGYLRRNRINVGITLLF